MNRIRIGLISCFALVGVLGCVLTATSVGCIPRSEKIEFKVLPEEFVEPVETLRHDGLDPGAPPAAGYLKCLSVEEARKAIVGETLDSFISVLGRREIAAATGELLDDGLDLEECRDVARQRFQDAVLAFTPEEAQAFEGISKRLTDLLSHSYPFFAAQPWRFIKMQDQICGGFAYTREENLVFSARMVEKITKLWERREEAHALDKVLTLFAHEQMHVLQRLHPKLFAKLYEELWGFVPFKGLTLPWITAHQLTNPDAPSVNWLVPNPDPKGSPDYFWMRTLLKGEHPLPVMGEDFMTVAIHVDKVKSGGNGYRLVCDKNSVPAYTPMDECNDYMARFPIRNGHDHPNEIAAYMFELILLYDFLVSPGEGPDPVDRQVIERLDPFRKWCLAAFQTGS